MQREINQQPVQKQQYFWSIEQIFFASGFAGPFAGCYLLGKNFKSLGLAHQEKMSYIGGIAGLILLLTIVTLIPDYLYDQEPLFLVPLVVGSIVSYFAYFHQKQIPEKIEQGAKNFSYWRYSVVLFSVIFFQTATYVVCIHIFERYFG